MRLVAHSRISVHSCPVALHTCTQALELSGTPLSELILTLRTGPSSSSSPCAGQSECLLLCVPMKGAHGDCCRRQCLGSWVSAPWDSCSPAPPGTLLDQGKLLFPAVAFAFQQLRRLNFLYERMIVTKTGNKAVKWQDLCDTCEKSLECVP